MPETYAARTGRVNRRRAGTTRNVTARTRHLVAEERALRALLIGLAMARCAMAGSFIACALAEQLPKQLHGRFPLTEIDPPVGQDEP